MSGADWLLVARLLPELLTGLTLLALIGVDRFLVPHWHDDARFELARVFAGGSLLGTGLLSLFSTGLDPRSVFGGAMALDRMAFYAKGVAFILAAGSVMLARKKDAASHPAEFFALCVASALGLSLMASARDLILFFIAVEISGLSLYALAAFPLHKARSTEAALKYFMTGAVASAFALYGLSLLMGHASGTRFADLAAGLFSKPPTLLTFVGIVFSLAGLSFKLSAAPLHLYAPDVYRHAPLPVAAFIASASKVAATMALVRFVGEALSPDVRLTGWTAVQDQWVMTLGVIAAASMVLGNLAAVAQKGFRRLVAYSGVAHAGYIMVGLYAATAQGFAAALFYAGVYACANLGLFVLMARRQDDGIEGDSIAGFAGWSRSAPGQAIALGVFILSLAGLPPMAGFAGKFLLFLAAVRGPLGWSGGLCLVSIALAASCAGFYYYLKILKTAFVAEPADGAQQPTPGVPGEAWVLVAVVVLFGVMPAPVLEPLEAWVAAAFAWLGGV